MIALSYLSKSWEFVLAQRMENPGSMDGKSKGSMGRFQGIRNPVMLILEWQVLMAYVAETVVRYAVFPPTTPVGLQGDGGEMHL